MKHRSSKQCPLLAQKDLFKILRNKRAGLGIKPPTFQEKPGNTSTLNAHAVHNSSIFIFILDR